MTITALQTEPLPAGQNGERGKLRVLVVDDHAAVRLGVQRLLDDERDLWTEAVASGAEAIEAAGRHPFDVAVVDYQLAHGEDGLTVTCDLRELPEAPRVLVYSAYADTPLAVLAKVAGADGVLSKAGLGDDLCQAVRDLARGRQRWPVLPRPIIFSLSLRLPLEQRGPFRLWAAGASDAEVAAECKIGAPALARCRRRILEALGEPEGSGGLPLGDGSWPLSYARARRFRTFGR
jgi:DNA-binding NarL/FixJ family response regulator